ncbi:MOSC domain-containing protein [Catellatospora methionotrophica]|uniref:MOSC domain-containing protein n=1 Tax=Catellatospora methionotrophica TaxID=121620 RepID=UPI0033F8F3A4
MGTVLSVNLGRAKRCDAADVGVSAIDKHPVAGPVELRAPGPKDGGLGSGVVGDEICDHRHHGGDDQAVYAYAQEDLDGWMAELGRDIPAGMFGENLTTSGIDVNGARIGERWQVGDEAVLEVSLPRIPCRTFADQMREQGWIRTFTKRALPGAYLRVIVPGRVSQGDPVTVLHRPDHDVTVSLTFRALTLEPDLLPALLAADALPEKVRDKARLRSGR